jgi:hypothetical protein
MNKDNPVCQQSGCTGWCDVTYVNGQEWLKCRTCGAMRKVIKRIINLVKGTKND